MPCIITKCLLRHINILRLQDLHLKMLTFVVCLCHNRPLFEGLKWTSTFLIVSSCPHCTLIWAARPGISSKQRGSPCLLISHGPHIHTQRNTHDWLCPCMCTREYKHTHSRTYSTHTILIPVHELMRTSFSYHTLYVTWWSSTILSLLTFKNITESSQEPPACLRQHGGLMVPATTL